MSWTWSLIKRSQGSLFYRLESTTHKNVRECTYCVQLYLCFNLQHKSNQIDVFVDSKRPQYYVQVYTGCNHQAFRSILGQNEEWLDPEHFSGFSRVFFRVKDVQWCSTYEIHWKLLEHLRFQHLSTSQGPWCAVQRTERKAGPATLWQRYATWDMGRSCISQLLHDGSVMARIDSTEVRVRTTHSVPAAWMHLEIIWMHCVADLTLSCAMWRCGFDGEMHLESRRGFVGCSSRAASSQRGHRLPQIFREMPMPEKHI